MDVLANIPLLITIAGGLGAGWAFLLLAKRDTTVKILQQNNAALIESNTLLTSAKRDLERHLAAKDHQIAALTEQNTKLATGVVGRLEQLTKAVKTVKDGDGS